MTTFHEFWQNIRSASLPQWVRAVALAVCLVAGSLITADYAMTRVVGWVPRQSLQDVRAAEFYTDTSIVGDCDLTLGRIRVLTLGRTSEEAVNTWWHEYEHCYVWPRLSQDQKREIAAYGTLEIKKDPNKYFGKTLADKVEEYAAEVYAEACAGKNIFVPPALRAYLQECGGR